MNEKTIKMKVAVFEYASGDLLSGMRTVSHHDMSGLNAIRITEWQEVEFTPIPADQVVPEMVAAIDKEIDEINQETIAKVNKLKSQKSELLALTVMP
jgi:peroxiredoxin family protein